MQTICENVKNESTEKRNFRFYIHSGMGKNNIYESNDLFKYEKIACQG
jgi:hypothetical protein